MHNMYASNENRVKVLIAMIKFTFAINLKSKMADQNQHGRRKKWKRKELKHRPLSDWFLARQPLREIETNWFL